MASKKSDKPHFKDWVRNFSKSAIVSTKEILEESMPNLKVTKDSAVEIAKDARAFITRTKTGMNVQSRSLSTTQLGKSAMSIMKDAMDDIRTGNFSLEKSAGYSMEYDDDSFYGVDEGLDLDNPDEYAINEERRNAAKIGKAISRTSAASIEGMRAMTHTLSNVTIKSNEASTAKILNLNLYGFNQINAGLSQINTHLYNVNENLSAMIRFQNENTSATNQAALEYYEKTSEMLDTLGRNISEMIDTNGKLSKLDNVKEKDWLSNDEFSMSNGFDLKEYGKFIKRNIMNNPIVSLASSFGSMASMGGQEGMKEMFRPTKMLMEAIIKKTILPKNTRKALGKFDTRFNQVLQNLLYKLGDAGEDYGSGMLTRLFGSIFGMKRSKVNNVYMGNFKKDSMNWNGQAQKALIEVIPSYLSNIEAAVDALNYKLGVPGNTYNRRYYDMENGVFKSERMLTKEMKESYTNSIEYEMNKISTKIEEAISNSTSSQEDKQKTLDQINEIINKRIDGRMGNTREYNTQMKSLLANGAGMGTRDISSVMLDLEDSIQKSIENINDFNKKIEYDSSVYRFMLNNGQKISSYRSNANIFSGREWLNGIDLGSLSAEEATRRRQEEEDRKRMEEIKKGFMNRITGLFGSRRTREQRSYDDMMAENINKMNDLLFRGYESLGNAMDGSFIDDSIDRVGAAIEGFLDRVEQATQDEETTQESPQAEFEDTRRFQETLNRSNSINLDQLEGNVPSQAEVNQRRSKGRANPKQYRMSLLIPNNIDPNNIRPIQADIHQHRTLERSKSDPNQYAMNLQLFASRRNQRKLNIKQRKLKNNSKVINLSRRLDNTVNGTIDRALNSSIRQIDQETANSTAVVEDTLDNVDGMDAQTANTMTLKGYISDIHNNFLKPMTSRIFGKDGFFANFFKHPAIQKGIDYLKDKLFNEQNGLLTPIVAYFKDGVNYLKYQITGKEYTDRKGKKHPKKEENTVLTYIRDTYDFVFTNTMKYLFGDDYKKNSVFKDIFRRFDWKGNKKKKDDREKGIVKSDKIQSIGTKYKDRTDKDEMKQKAQEIGSKIKSVKINKTDDNTIESNPQKIKSQINLKKSDTKISKKLNSEIVNNVTNTISETTETISSAGKTFSDSMLGEKEKKDDFLKEFHQENKKSFEKLKKKFPKLLAGAGIGAGLVALSGGNAGMLGSLFLPSSLIGGAMLGVATTLLSENEKFKKFVFGEEDEFGVKKNGLISDKMQKAFKASLPLVVGGATLGALKSLVFGPGMLGRTHAGALINSLLPGGVIGGAILGTGLALLKNNETINRILFGKNPDDENGKKGILTKGMNKISSFMGGSKKFILGGLKGLGAGLLSGAVVSHMGIMGAALTTGGPIGMAIAGMATGIALQTRRFKELLFGTEEFDEEGNPTGKRNKDGLFTQVRNMLVVNVFQPIKDSIKDKVIDFAYWAKKQIMYPFRKAFGPILDSLSEIKDNVGSFLKDKFEALSTSIGEAFKKAIKTIFSPFTRIFGAIGRGLLNVTAGAARMALMPVSLPLKLLAGATSWARGKENISFMGSFLKSSVPGLRDKWANDETDYGTGVKGFFNKMKSRVADVKKGYVTSREEYNKLMTVNGYNHLNHRGVYSELRQDKREQKDLRAERRQRKKIDKLTKQFAREDKYKMLPNWSDSKLIERQEKLKKAGVNMRGIKTIEDIQDLMYNRSVWDEKFDPYTIARNEAKINAKDEKFQQETRDYQESVKQSFATLIDLIRGEAEAHIEKKRKKVSDKRYKKQLSKIKKNAKRAGLSREDLEGYDLSKYVGYMDIPQSMWEEYLESPEFENSDLDGWINKNLDRIYEYDEEKVVKYRKRRNLNSPYLNRQMRGKLGENQSPEEILQQNLNNRPTVSMAELENGHMPNPASAQDSKNFQEALNRAHSLNINQLEGNQSNRPEVSIINSTEENPVQSNIKRNKLESSNDIASPRYKMSLLIPNNIRPIQADIHQNRKMVRSKSNPNLYAYNLQQFAERQRTDDAMLEQMNITNRLLSGGAYDENKFYRTRMPRIKGANVKKSTTDVLSNTEANEAHISQSEDQSAQKSSAKLFASSLLSGMAKNKKKEDAKNKENEETKKSRALGNKDKEKNEEENKEGIIETLNSESDGEAEKEKKGIISTLLGGTSSVLGSIFGWLTSGGAWKKWGIGIAIASLFSDQIKESKIIPKIGDFISQNFGVVADFFSTNIPKLLEGLTTFVTDYGPNIIATTADTIGNLMPDLLNATFTIGKSVVTSIGDNIASSIGAKTKAKIIDSPEKAQALLDQGINLVDNGDGTYTQYGDRTYITEDGKVTSAINTSLVETAVKHPKSAYKVGKGVFKAATYIPNKLVKTGAKMVDGTLALTEKGVKSVANKFGKRAAEEVAEKSAKNIASATIKIGENGITYTSKAVRKATLKGAAKATVEGGAKSTAGKWFQAVLKKLEKLTSNPKIAKIIDGSVLSGPLKSLKNLISRAVSLLPENSILSRKITAKMAAGTAEAAGKGSSRFIPFIGTALTVYDAVSGFFEAANLFDVNKSDVDFGMNIVSSLMKTILGLGIGPLFDLCLELLSEILGQDVKKEFASWLYKSVMSFFGDTAAIERLDANQTLFQQEVDNYNRANGTNLSAKAYSDLKNAPWWKKKWDKFRGNSVDYSQYEVGNFDASKYASTSTTNSAALEYNYYNYEPNTGAVVNNQQATDTNTGYGSGPKMTSHATQYGRTVGYGLSQKDPRWANYPIGKFSDGSTSTMATGGCGPTALSMVANGLTSNKTNPLSVAKFAKSNGYISDGGANENLFTDGANKMGLKSSKVSSGGLLNALKSGNTMIVAGKSNKNDSPYTSAGHILAVKGSSNGNAIVSDPETGRTTEMSPNKLRSGMTYGWSYKNKSVGYGNAEDEDIPVGVQIPVVDDTPKFTDYKSEIKTVEQMKATGQNWVIRPKDLVSYAARQVKAKAIGMDKSYVSPTELSFNEMLYNKGKLDHMTEWQKANPSRWKRIADYATDKVGESVGIIGLSTDNPRTTSSTLMALYEKGNMQTEEDITFGNYTVPKGTINWENPKFYINVFYSDITRLYNLYPELMRYGFFNIIYGNLNNFRSAGGSKISEDDINSLFGAYTTRQELYDGISSLSNDSASYLKYKNGAVFYQQNDAEWNTIPWKSTTIGNAGDDLTSMSMIFSTYSNNALTPKYIYNNWLPTNEDWYDEEKGLTKKAFADGGLNGMLESRSSDNTGQRLRISENNNPSSIENALRSKKLVYMKGYQYTDSIFGGTGDKSEVNPKESPLHSVVGTYVNNDVIAVNDPSTDENSFSLFPVDRLSDTVGNNTSVVKEAYIVTNPDGTGANLGIDVNSMKLPESKYKDASKETTWLGKTSAILGNFISVIENLIEAQITGKDYETIKAEKFKDTETGYDEGEQSEEAIIESTDTENTPSETQGTVVSNKQSQSNNSNTNSNSNTESGSKPAMITNDSYNPKVVNGGAITAKALPKQKHTGGVGTSTSGRTHSGGSGRSMKTSVSSTINNFASAVANKINNQGLNYDYKTNQYSRSLGNGPGTKYNNPFLRILFGIEEQNSTSENGTIDDGVKPVGTEKASMTDWIGKYVEKNESGTEGPAMVSSGSGDYGGVSFGTYQFPSYGKSKAESSTELYQFWSKYYASQYPNVTPGNNTAFIDKWKSLARSNPDEFHKNEHNYIGTKYYIPQKNQLKGVLDPDTHSRSAQEMVWSSGVQYGPNSTVIKKALNSQDSQNMGVKSLVNTVQDYKSNTIDQYFSKCSSSVRAGVKNRHDKVERQILLDISDKPPLEGIGGGSSNITIGYGKGIDALANMAKGLAGVGNALTASIFGGTEYKAGDYKEYMNTSTSQKNQNQEGATSNTSSSGADVVVELPSEFKIQEGNKKDFVSKILAGTMKHSIGYGLLPSITLAQAALESGWGKSGLATKGKNLFGIKAGSSWKGQTITMPTTEYYGGKKVSVNAAFRKYDSYADSIRDHAELLMNTRYAKVKSATNYKIATQALKDAGYATAPDYPSSLNNLIETNNFAYFDRPEVIDSYRSKVAGYGKGKNGIIVDNKGFAIGYGSAEAARASVVAVMKSLERKLQYSRARRNPEQGSGDCSSTVQYCYRKAINMDVGGNSRVQGANPKGIDVDRGSGKGPTVSNLKPGDLLFYGNRSTGYISHVEMYVGDGQLMGHGHGVGPNYHNAATYRMSEYIKARRFIKDGTEVDINTVNTGIGTENTETENATVTSKSPLNPFSEVMNKISNVAQNAINNVINSVDTKSTSKSKNKKSTKKTKSNKKSVGKGTGIAESYFERTLGGHLTSKYGLGYGIGNGFHRGIDIGAELDSPIYSPIDGTVISNQYDPVGFGNHVVVQDDAGYNHIFAHMNKRSNLGVGQRINTDDIIGSVGSTGKSTGNHLHYEVRKGFDKYSSVNPNDYAKSVGFGKGNTKSKSMSIYEQQMKTKEKDPYEEIGGSSKNISSSNIIKKLNVAVNTDGVENKLDILIDVMKDWASKSMSSNNTPTNSTNVGFGKGNNKSNSSSSKTVVINSNNNYPNYPSKESINQKNRHTHNLVASVESYI